MSVGETLNVTTLAVLLISATVAWPITWLLLLSYRRQVVRAMRRSATNGRGGDPMPAAGVPRSGGAARGPAAPSVAGERSRAIRPTVDASLTRGERLRRAVLRRYALAGAAQATVLTIATLSATQIAFTPVRTVTVWLAYAWPLVLTWALLSEFDRRLTGRAVVGYLALLATAGLVVGTPLGGFAVWLLLSSVPTVVAVVYLHRSVRAVAALVVVVVFAGALGALALTGFVGATDARLDALAGVAIRTGVGAVAALAIVGAVGFVLAAALGVVLLRAVGFAYRERGVPADLVQVGSLWALFALVQGAPLARVDPAWSLAAPVAIAAFLLVAGRRISPSDEAVQPPRLLLLRVFALGRRSEDLFRAVSSRWQYVGPIRLITGPDLARSTVEPDEFLTFAAGRLDDLVVTDPSQVGSGDDGQRFRDRHGRHRVREHLCAGDTWQAVVARLVVDTDLVLVDVRGFDRTNAGTHHELVLLARTGMLARTALVVDASTDRGLVAEAVAAGGGALALATVLELGAEGAPSIDALTAAVPDSP